ncbi:MAG: DUF4097 family beta strand repeat-containing protein [Planctomycetota bacterium]|nr:DUF4097 family beta strand repeat-containing protein [Planctomycetota bacterium]
MRPLILPALLLAGCAYPTFVSSKVIELTIPASGLTTLDCTSHNGDIVVNGDAGTTEVALRAELSVRGYSQGEADANLHLLSLGKNFADGKLKIYGKYDPLQLNNMSPCFAFTLKVPQQVALSLASHNGDIRANGTRGTVAFESHNGDIVAEASTSQVKAETHNGLVRIDLANDGPLDGDITSHNGDIVVSLADGIGTSVTASTHNGDITPPRLLQDAVIKKRSLRCRIGDGAGKLQITTHNGDVHIR